MRTHPYHKTFPQGIKCSVAACAFVGFASGCAVEAEEISEPISDTEAEVVYDTPEWDLVTKFDGDMDHHINAGYGRATAQVSLGGSICSAVLISDDVLLSATHCRGEPPDSSSPTSLTATFGKYGNTPTDFTLGMAEGRKRFESHFGLSRSESRAAIADSGLTTFTCNLVDSEFTSGNGADVDIWRCSGNAFSLNTTPFGRTRNYQVLPGHVWGHTNVKVGVYDNSIQLDVLNVNAPAHFPTGAEAVLLSPNGRMLGSSGWGPFTSMGFKVIGADWNCGSSGGGIVDNKDHEVFGIVSGSRFTWNGSCSLNPVPDDDWITPLFTHNIGALIGSLSVSFQDEPAITDPLPASSVHLSPSVGSNTGGARTGLCPTSFAVAGFVASNNFVGGSSAIANLGPICLPYQRTRPLGLLDRTSIPQIDSALLSAFGTTGMPVVRGVDYNTYIHETLVAPNARSTQTVVMCPAGSYVSGMSLRSDGVLRSMPTIQCSEVTEFLNPITGVLSRNTSSADKPAISGVGGTLANSNCGPRSIAIGMLGRSNGVNATQARLHCLDL